MEEGMDGRLIKDQEMEGEVVFGKVGGVGWFWRERGWVEGGGEELRCRQQPSERGGGAVA
jgi:hypothetical protein